jgi:hypothetical protein
MPAAGPVQARAHHRRVHLRLLQGLDFQCFSCAQRILAMGVKRCDYAMPCQATVLLVSQGRRPGLEVVFCCCCCCWRLDYCCRAEARCCSRTPLECETTMVEAWRL